MTTTLTRSALDTLIGGLDSAIRASDPGMPTVDAVGTALQPFLGRRDLLRPEQRQGNPNAYRQHLLHVAADGAFSPAALVWLPGQATANPRPRGRGAWSESTKAPNTRPDTPWTPDGFSGRERLRGWAGVGDVAGLLRPGDIHKRPATPATRTRHLAARVRRRPEAVTGHQHPASLRPADPIHLNPTIPRHPMAAAGRKSRTKCCTPCTPRFC